MRRRINVEFSSTFDKEYELKSLIIVISRLLDLLINSIIKSSAKESNITSTLNRV